MTYLTALIVASLILMVIVFWSIAELVFESRKEKSLNSKKV